MGEAKMVSRRKLFVIFISVLVGFAGGLDSKAAGQEKQSYASLLARVKNFDRSVDFKALRLSYTETAEYQPYSKNVGTRLSCRGGSPFSGPWNGEPPLPFDPEDGG
jgi:hypothetical protein